MQVQALCTTVAIDISLVCKYAISLLSFFVVCLCMGSLFFISCFHSPLTCRTYWCPILSLMLCCIQSFCLVLGLPLLLLPCTNRWFSFVDLFVIFITLSSQQLLWSWSAAMEISFQNNCSTIMTHCSHGSFSGAPPRIGMITRLQSLPWIHLSQCFLTF